MELFLKGGGFLICETSPDEIFILEEFNEEAKMMLEATKEFNEKHSAFKSLGVRVFGLSKDTISSHISFSEKLNLQFPLLSDPQTQLIQNLNSWKEKSMYGKKYMGTERSTFLIDTSLSIKHIWRKVRVEGHVDQVFNKYKKLNEGLG